MSLEEGKNPNGGNRQGFEAVNVNQPKGNATMTSLALNTNFVKTMSSKQIADVVDSRHDHVKRSIERLVEKGVIVQPPMEDEQFFDKLGRPRVESVYKVNERDSYVVVAQLCPEFTAKLVDYWQATKNLIPTLQSNIKPSQISGAFRSCMAIAKLAGLTGNQAILSADKATKKLIGESPLALLEITHLHAPVQEASLTPTQIGEMLQNKLSARKVNLLLEKLGYQVKNGDLWLPTPSGEKYSEFLDAGKKHSDGTPVKQLKWYQSIVTCLNMEKVA